MSARNAVYGSMDSQGRINRRISKEDGDGYVVTGGNFNALKTACLHAKIEYLPEYRNLSKEAIDEIIRAA